MLITSDNALTGTCRGSRYDRYDGHDVAAQFSGDLSETLGGFHVVIESWVAQ